MQETGWRRNGREARGGVRLLGAALALSALAGLGYELWDRAIQDRLGPKRFSTVEPGVLYRSGQIHHSWIREVLEDRSIGLVIDLTGKNSDDPDEVAELAAVRELDVDYVRLPLRGDGTGNLAHYETALTLITEARERGIRTLVHCAAGSDRTGLAVAFYRMLVQGRSREEALREMERFGFDAAEDVEGTGFLDAHLGELRRRLRESGVIEDGGAAS